MPERFHEAHRRGLERYLTTGEARVIGKTVELAGRRRDGSEFPLELSLSTWKSRRGAFFTGILSDITERKHAQEVARRAEELARTNEELAQFASVASHDLQEPLRKIVAFGDRLKSRLAGSLDEQGQDHLERMQNAAQRMGQLIESLLELSRATAKGGIFESVDLNTVVSEVLVDLEARIKQTGGRVEVQPLPTLIADRLQMRQLLQNLIGNALKFHKQNEVPVVQLSSRANENGAWEIHVVDNGIGFEEKYLDRIFRPFQRLHGRGEFEGSGMGLAICNKIAARHSGQITAHSQAGIGSNFVVTLPARPKTKEARAS
jgi:two-component system sensor kinase FixL